MVTKERMPDIKSVTEYNRPRSWVIYGRSGAGKTTYAATFPKPLLLLDVRDEGVDSIKNVKGCDFVSIQDWEDFEDVYMFLLHNPKKYKTLVIDTVTQMQNVCLEWVLAKKKKKVDRIGDWGTMTRREWGDASASMKEKITSFRDLPMEVMFIAQERTTVTDDDEDTDTQLMVPEVGPNAMKSVTGHLNASVSVIGHQFIKLRTYQQKVRGKNVEMEEPVHCLRLGSNPIYITKTRKPKEIEIPQYIENPTYQDSIDALEGKL